MLGSFDGRPLSRFKRVKQITSSHCGPAVLQMLLSGFDVMVGQNEIVEAGDAGFKIDTHGMTVMELSKAAQVLAPGLAFWYKSDAGLGDLSRLINEYHIPIGVEWQGKFKPEDQDDDDGHYSVVTQVDLGGNLIAMVDPYYYTGYDRRFSVREFYDRWWDTNEIIDRVNGRRYMVEDYHMMFIVAPILAGFPEELGMIKV